ncbi:Crossover junction endonuclease mus81 [Puccinia graminis f. sp. tritici]|uniref:Crossover junction endonuclease mus81 n=1 Tax=Puccinia graminis f. sp. tritici TaxID=56615 RepID=A0A5B0LYC0_PUCGR|nr:Crossover junction endonuclease mus81 [Puccinia graminis f. sp. tritici]
MQNQNGEQPVQLGPGDEELHCAALKNDLLMNGNPRLSESPEGSIGPWKAFAQTSFESGQSNPSGRRSSDDIQPEVRKLGSDFDICVVLDHREKISSPGRYLIRVLQRAPVVGNAIWIAVHRDDQHEFFSGLRADPISLVV